MKRFCANCNYEKVVANVLTTSGGSPEFCKICACETKSYWADEPRSDFFSSGGFRVTPLEELESLLPIAKEPICLRKPPKSIEDVICKAWERFAKKRIRIAESKNEKKKKLEYAKLHNKPKKSKVAKKS